MKILLKPYNFFSHIVTAWPFIWTLGFVSLIILKNDISLYLLWDLCYLTYFTILLPWTSSIFFIYVLTSNNSTRLHGFGASQVFICMTVCVYKFSGSTLLHHCNNNLLDDHFVSVNQALDLLRSVLLYWWLSYFTQKTLNKFFFFLTFR